MTKKKDGLCTTASVENVSSAQFFFLNQNIQKSILSCNLALDESSICAFKLDRGCAYTIHTTIGQMPRNVYEGCFPWRQLTVFHLGVLPRKFNFPYTPRTSRKHGIKRVILLASHVLQTLHHPTKRKTSPPFRFAWLRGFKRCLRTNIQLDMKKYAVCRFLK